MGCASRGCKASGLCTKCRVSPHPQLLQTRPEFFPCSSEYLGAETRVCHQVLPKFSVRVALTSACCEVLVSSQALLAASPTQKLSSVGEGAPADGIPKCAPREAVQQRSVEQGRLFAVSPALPQLTGYGGCRSRSLALASLSSPSQKTLGFFNPHTSPTCLTLPMKITLQPH